MLRLGHRMSRRSTMARPVLVRVCQYGTEASADTSRPNKLSQTLEKSAHEVSPSDLGKFFCLSEKAQLVTGDLANKWTRKLFKMTVDQGVMVRKPAVDVIAAMNTLREIPRDQPFWHVPHLHFVPKAPASRGVGRTFAWYHTVQAALDSGWVVVAVPRAHRWTERTFKVRRSRRFPGLFDQPMETNEFLTRFKAMNSEFCDEVQVTADLFEGTEGAKPAVLDKDSMSLREFIDVCINTTNDVEEQPNLFDALHATFEILRSRCNDRNVAILVDGISAFDVEQSLVHDMDQLVPVPPSSLTLVRHTMSLAHGLENSQGRRCLISTTTEEGVELNFENKEWVRQTVAEGSTIDLKEYLEHVKTIAASEPAVNSRAHAIVREAEKKGAEPHQMQQLLAALKAEDMALWKSLNAQNVLQRSLTVVEVPVYTEEELINMLKHYSDLGMLFNRKIEPKFVQLMHMTTQGSPKEVTKYILHI
eukprot:Clim_evm18s207 gene=Clim_evmTU18s207